MESSLGEERADVDSSKENEQRPANIAQLPSESVKPESETSEIALTGADRTALNFDTESESGNDKPSAKRKSKRKQYV